MAQGSCSAPEQKANESFEYLNDYMELTWMEGCEQDLTSDPRRAVKNGERIVNTLRLTFPDVIDVLYSARNVQRKLLISFFLIILGNHICDVGCLVDNHIQTIYFSIPGLLHCFISSLVTSHLFIFQD